MKKQIFLSIFAFALSLNAHAQSADLASEITGVSDEKLQQITKEKSEKQIADDRGIFSFLNFSFIKKPLSIFSSEEDIKTENSQAPTEEQAQPEIKETPLERVFIRPPNCRINCHSKFLP